ncbi:MAG: hypothetical protein JSW26_01165 [Desulfobacterales bacterium]|nr:MAG: hypothetical protein JSW26_01165 [Desulfobacterales bacterium]
MLFAMPSYEVKYHGKTEWEAISEVKVLVKLQEAYDKVTPVIQDLIDGKQVPTPQAVFRIRGYNEVEYG